MLLLFPCISKQAISKPSYLSLIVSFFMSYCLKEHYFYSPIYLICLRVLFEKSDFLLLLLLDIRVKNVRDEY